MSTNLDARQRSAETKRTRTREALINAARERFAANGWQATRVEDIARDAGVGVATAFTHFNKQTLLAHVYAPLVNGLIDKAESELVAGKPPEEVLVRQVRRFATMCRKNQPLTFALVAAVHEQTVSSEGPPRSGDDADVRNIVRIPAILQMPIEYGQRSGEFAATPPAADIATYHANALLLRTVTRPGESVNKATEIVLSQLLPALQPK
ncbi:TetR/AcrR family transcriptional regulator [Millisia brevis]|uniref:TetR/AcrR family transcriptional regulator n=1 Tax=Millisia brevis TaxID=264148 RepID=UPI0014708FE2|nr:TetR/AcrR family transcriptional regulator [Millisia brevis]